MKQITGELYQCAFAPELKNHILNDMGFNSEDQTILQSLMEHNAPSAFHYDNTGIGRERFERRLNSINRVILPELVRLANNSIKTTA